jgi:K+-transporting ATPase KdpF subunit
LRRERFDFYRHYRRLLFHQQPVRAVLRKTVKGTMESIIVGIIALLLFGYLFVAMIRPEKF